jgi:hypothetical protein
MKIYNDFKSIIKDSDNFVRDNPKKAIFYSIALKVFCFALLLLKAFNPFYLSISSLILLSASFFFDYKIFSNIDQIVIQILQNGINSQSFESGYRSGRFFVSIIKTGCLDKVKGFFVGVKDEIFA